MFLIMFVTVYICLPVYLSVFVTLYLSVCMPFVQLLSVSCSLLIYSSTYIFFFLITIASKSAINYLLVLLFFLSFQNILCSLPLPKKSWCFLIFLPGPIIIPERRASLPSSTLCRRRRSQLRLKLFNFLTPG